MGSLRNRTLHPQETLMLIYLFFFLVGTKGIGHVFTLVLKPGHQAPKKQGVPQEWGSECPVCHQKFPQFRLEGTHTTQEEQGDGIKEIY